MKKLLYSIAGSVLAGGVCVGLSYAIGWLFGPLYYGEDESTRNFVIFLWALAGFVVAGAVAGYRFGRVKS